MSIKKDEPEPIVIILLCILVPLIVAGLFESVIFGIAYFSADTIKCTWLWCEFTTERRQAHTVSTQDCFVNGVRSNCTQNITLPQWLNEEG